MTNNYAQRLIAFAPWYFFLLSEEDKLNKEQAAQFLADIYQYGLTDPDCECSRTEMRKRIKEEFPELVKQVFEADLKRLITTLGVKE